MGVSDIMLGSSFPTAALLLAAATFVAYCRIARRRTIEGNETPEEEAHRERILGRTVPAALSLVRAHLDDLAQDVDDKLPRQFRLIDRWIEESDLEIARLQRRLAAQSSATVSLSRREPDILPLEGFTPGRIAIPADPHVDHRKIRRAA